MGKRCQFLRKDLPIYLFLVHLKRVMTINRCSYNSILIYHGAAISFFYHWKQCNQTEARIAYSLLWVCNTVLILSMSIRATIFFKWQKHARFILWLSVRPEFVPNFWTPIPLYSDFISGHWTCSQDSTACVIEVIYRHWVEWVRVLIIKRFGNIRKKR